jgi:uncharacterized membrane protein required for colicin V production
MIPDWVSLVDVVFLGVALLFAFAGLQKGFSGQVAHILTFVILGIVLFYVYPGLFSYFGRVLRNVNETYLMWMILAGLVALSIGIFMIASKLLEGMLKAQISNHADHFYGFGLGFVRGVLLGLLVMIFLVILGPPKIYDGFSAKSKVGKLVCLELAPRIKPHMTRAMLEEKTQQLRDKLLEQEEGGAID